MDYPLENLGPERFQQLCQALLVLEHPQVQCFPVAQPDGGRDAVAFYSYQRSKGKFLVFQVKYARRPLVETDPHKWLAAIAEQEAPKVSALIPRGATAYYLITNIPGTSHLDTGSIDRVNQQLAATLNVPAFCWWRDDINRRLDSAWNLKWTYPEVMTGPDFLRAIIDSGISEHRERRSLAIRAFLRSQYDADEEVRFKQVELQNKLLDLFIDVPVSVADQQPDKRTIGRFRRAVYEVQASSEELPLDLENDLMISPNEPGARWFANAEEHIGAATFLLSSVAQRLLPLIVLEGAPGQGKSTIVQYVCQVQRMLLLGERQALSSIPPKHAASPVRLPIKADLRDFATWLGKRDPFAADLPEIGIGWNRSLEGFLAALISYHSGGTTFSVDDLLSVARISSLLLIFDGLDEVAGIHRRQEVVDEIVKGVQRLHENAAHLQAVVTSRPAAFANSPGMPRNKYPHLQLLSLTRPLITEYADRWLRARKSDSRQISEFRAVLREKLDQPHLRDLARNPMQLAILLSLIHTRGASLPDKRTALYDYYIDLFFSREASKSSVVRDHRELLIDIHRYLAWLLHSEAEQGESHASITQDRLQHLVTDYLRQEGHDAGIADALFTGMVERVVALVSRVQGTFEFEVQPLREYFAACHLYYTAPQSSPGKEHHGAKPDRFDAICRNFYWLNVTRFFAGCYSKGELPSLVERMQELCVDDRFNVISYPANLASTLLGDWVFTQNPKSVREVIGLVLEPDRFRRFLAPLTVRRRRTIAHNLLNLPTRCGREELIATCFKLLDSDLQEDFESQVIGVLRANEDKQVIAERWKALISDAPANRRLRWLNYGVDLGIVPLLPVSEIERLTCDLDARAQTQANSILFRASRHDYIQESEARFDTAINLILDRSIRAQPQKRIESALHALSHAVDPGRYALAFKDRQPLALNDVLETRHRVTKLIWPDQLLTNTETFTAHTMCVELARTAERESQRSTIEWATEIGPWESLIERGRSLWGERWAFANLANVAAGIRSQSEKSSAYSNLLDHAQSLTRRVRFARLRSGGKKWWSQQLAGCDSMEDRLFAMLVGFTWAKAETLLSNKDQISSELARLGQSEWEKLIYSVRRCKALADPKSDSTEPVAIRRPRFPDNERFLVLVMDRADAQTRQKIYKKLDPDGVSDPVLMEYIYRCALDAERFGTEAWAPNLDVVKKSYKLGHCDEPSAMYRPGGTSQPKLPLKMAQQIVGCPSEFPSFLVAMSEERVRAETAAAIKPIAEVATAERWFD